MQVHVMTAQHTTCKKCLLLDGKDTTLNAGKGTQEGKRHLMAGCGTKDQETPARPLEHKLFDQPCQDLKQVTASKKQNETT